MTYTSTFNAQLLIRLSDFKDDKLTSSDDDMSEYGSEDDDDDFDLDFGPGSNQSNGGAAFGKGSAAAADAFGFDDMRHYMEQMDRELSHTEMGKTFVTEVQCTALAVINTLSLKTQPTLICIYVVFHRRATKYCVLVACVNH